MNTHTHVSQSKDQSQYSLSAMSYFHLLKMVRILSSPGTHCALALAESHFARSLDTPHHHCHANGPLGLVFMGPQEDPPGTPYCLQCGAHI